ncbi:hypothetical protein [Comamonas resistens]|uniref:hypothetical protein n=1 Tax=Comamonas resistens TaxID=3046670 RepID=UPI0039BCA04A
MNTQHFIAATELRDFLKSMGWHMLDEALRDRLFVFNHPQYERRQLVYPMEHAAPDYAEAVERVFEKLAEISHTSVPALRGKARAVHDDVLSFHIHFDGGERSLPLDFAAALLAQTESLIKAAACTVLRPQAHYPRLALGQANQLIEKTRFQHTEHGSFVIKTSCPVNALETQGELDWPMEEGHVTPLPFVREVNLVLNRALQELVTAIEGDKLAPLLDRLKRGDSPLISSNLCAALVGMQDEKLENDLSICFGWAASLPQPSPTAIPASIRFQRDYFPRIEEVRRELRGTQVQREEVFIGTVERLEGAMNEQGQRAGDVVLSLLQHDEDGVVKAKVHLQPDHYAQAVHAHQTNGAYVQVKGQLQPGSRLRQLMHVKSFDVIGLAG